MAGDTAQPTASLLPVQDARGALAVFDLDRTLLPGSSLLALGRALAQAGLVSRRRLATAAVQERRYRARGAPDGEVDRLRAEALAHVAGLERAALVDVAATVARRLRTAITPAARHLVERHLVAGDFVVVLSASPQELVDAVAAEIGAHRAVGTRAEVLDGRYTGRLDGPFCYGAGKLQRLFADVGRIPLGPASAYADSASDLPVLEACGHPVAVNPDRRLRAVAQRRGWPILAFA
jgi:HAD superfamily hydrolase (TIGR01490 family)